MDNIGGGSHFLIEIIDDATQELSQGHCRLHDTKLSVVVEGACNKLNACISSNVLSHRDLHPQADVAAMSPQSGDVLGGDGLHTVSGCCQRH